MTAQAPLFPLDPAVAPAPAILPPGKPGLYTIGYGGRLSNANLLSLLVQQGVTILADVRLSPSSRIPGFTRPALARACNAYNMRYVWIEALGNLNYKSTGTRLKDPRRGLAELKALIEQGTVALLCACRKHDDCHRAVIAEKVKKQVPGLAVVPLP